MTSTTDRELVVVRELKAPIELVWDVWTKPEHIVHWWGPDGFTYTIYEMTVKPGGIWRFIMHAPGGHDFPNRILYKEVNKPAYLSYEHGSDIDDDPRKFYVTTSFEAIETGTRVTTKMLFGTAEQLKEVIKKYGALEVNRQSTVKLEAYLKTMQ